MDERIKELIDYIKMLQVALECSTDPEDIEADNLMDAIWESKMELKELGYEGWEEVYMDNEKQKQEVIDFLENTYTGAKMMGDEEVMLRASRALLAFKADVHKDIFIEENVLEF